MTFSARIAGLLVLLLALPAAVAQPGSPEAEVREAVTGFNGAYADDRVDDYFEYYAEDALVYFYGARQDLAVYEEEWADMVAAGGSVERNDLSDLRIQVMPGAEVAVATYFVAYRLRTPDGEVSAADAFESDVWQKIDGSWKLVNVHYSELP